MASCSHVLAVICLLSSAVNEALGHEEGFLSFQASEEEGDTNQEAKLWNAFQESEENLRQEIDIRQSSAGDAYTVPIDRAAAANPDKVRLATPATAPGSPLVGTFSYAFLTFFSPLVVNFFASSGFLDAPSNPRLASSVFSADKVVQKRVASLSAKNVTKVTSAPSRQITQIASAPALSLRRQLHSNIPAEKLESFSAHVLNNPRGRPTGSLIWLLPWMGKKGWLKTFWLTNSGYEEFLNRTWRVIEAVGRQRIDWDGNLINAWYFYDNWEADIPKYPELDAAVLYVHSLIEQEYSIVQDYQRIIIAGYSQGANLALEVGLRFHSPLALVFSNRGVLFQERTENASTHFRPLQRHTASPTPYIFTAGTDDSTYWLADIEQDCEYLHIKGSPSFLRVFDGLDHFAPSYPEIDLLVSSIEVVLAHKPPTSIDELDKVAPWVRC